jgi:von Willebrand factor type A domain
MASVSPTTPDETQYNVVSSTAFIAGFTMLIDAGESDSFFVTYPENLAGAAFTLVHVAQNGTRTELPLPPGGTAANWTVTPTTSTSGGVTQLTVSISDEPGNGGTDGESWELRASANALAPWTFSRSTDNLAVQWLAVDPTAVMDAPATVLEQAKDVVLNAADANPVGTVAGTLPAGIAPTYTWTHSGGIPITGLGSSTTTADPSVTVTLPGVYEAVDVPLRVTTAFADAPDNLYTGFLQTTSAPDVMRVDPRPQKVVLVIDRSGSMALEKRYQNAKAACRVLVHLLAGLREGVNSADEVAIIAFEDGQEGFRGGQPSSLIKPLLALTPLAQAVTAIDDATFDFGAPGGFTPIGDGLLVAIDMLAAAGVSANERITICLMTDGEENSGTTALVPQSAVNGAIPFAQAVGPQFTQRQAVVDPQHCTISAIALGPTANQGVLSQLTTAFGAGTFALADDPSELFKEFGHMLETSQKVNELTGKLVPTTGVEDPDKNKFVPPGNAVYLSTEADADRLVLSVIPPAGTTVFTDTIRLARWSGTEFVDEPVTPLESESDRSVSVSNLPTLANGQPIHWRVIHGTSPETAHELKVAQVLSYVDLHLLADVILDKRAFQTGDRMTLTVRIRQDAASVLGSTVRAELTAPDVGLGEALSEIGHVADDARQLDANDAPTWMERRIGTLLSRRDWQYLPRSKHTHPEGLFVDGTDELFDPDGDGNYTNVFDRVFEPGTYAWRLFVDGLDVNGNPYNRTLSISTFVTIKVDPEESRIKVVRVHNHPSHLLAAQVIVTPQNARRKRLGPGKDDNVIWSVRAGRFEHIVLDQPEPVFADGTYRRVVLYKPTQRPFVTVNVTGVVLPTIDVRRALLGLGARDDTGDSGR